PARHAVYSGALASVGRPRRSRAQAKKAPAAQRVGGRDDALRRRSQRTSSGFSVLTYLRAQVEIAGGSVGGKALMLREPVRRDRIVTILPSGKVRPSSTLRPLYSFPHVGRKRISEETGAARRGQLCRGPPYGFRRVQGFALTSYCNDGARHAADHHVSRRCQNFHFTAASLSPTQVRGTGRGQGRRHGRRRRQRRGADAGRAAAGRRSPAAHVRRARRRRRA
ncbi:unnamed protein product, partial [Pelagomonas calceolata]